VETGLEFQHVTWEQPFGGVGPAESNIWSLSIEGRPGLDRESALLSERDLASSSPVLWKVTAEYRQETAHHQGEPGAHRNWWRFFLQWGI
jgi:hypothetical protein